MAIRSSSRIKREVISTRGPGHDVRGAVSYHASAILILSVVVSLVSLGFALCMLKFYVAQDQFRLALDLVAGKVLSVEEQQAAGVGPAATAHVYEASSVPGIYLSYTQCPPGELGECNDLIVAQRVEGGYRVLVRSVRSLMSSLGYDTLAVPVAVSADGQMLAFRLGEEGDTGTLQERVVLFDIASRRIQEVEASIPMNAAFRSDLAFVAYVDPAADAIILMEMSTGKKKTAVRAGATETFVPSPASSSRPELTLTDSTVTFSVYTDVSPITPIERRTVSVSF